MVFCGDCGGESLDGSRFCGHCGRPLEGGLVAVARERKVVTSLFCDLVGFTAMSEAADPEDVDAVLGAYFAAARSAIEAFGGTVEKFIGDAVVGVFGVPAVHEDDPERAVRAGLRIVEAVEDLTCPDGQPLRLRVGVNTGDALVRLGVLPGSVEGFLTGDAVNTAARIQSVAPVMGVAVGRSTFEATKLVFDYVELEPVAVKGKSESVGLWQAVAPLARFGTDITRRHGWRRPHRSWSRSWASPDWGSHALSLSCSATSTRCPD
jgi:class 3 adenylate cyclase